MSVQDERELRERLGGLLDGIEPRRAPVFRAMRQGRGIRMRRWVYAVAGVVVLAGGSVALPGLLHGQNRAAPAAAPRFTATVNKPARNAPAGLIASGTEDGHRWTVVLTGHGKILTVSGQRTETEDLGNTFSFRSGTPIQTTYWGGTGYDGTVTILGLVRSVVTRVTIVMQGGKVLTLTPVAYDGQRYVGVVIPSQAPIVRAVAYFHYVELAYSIPYQRHGLDNWWAPGEVGPAKLTKAVADHTSDGHAWRVVAQFGPWGYCFSEPNSSLCLDGPILGGLTPSRQVVTELVCNSLNLGNPQKMPMVGLALARSDVHEVVLRFADGSTERYAPVDVKVAHVFAYLVPYHQKFLGATMYNAAGQKVGTSTGLGC